MLYELREKPDPDKWHAYTDAEIEKWGSFYHHPAKGGGYWVADREAYRPLNRKAKALEPGFPHQWIDMYALCKCYDINNHHVGLIRVTVKFTDGKVELIQQEY